MKFNLFLIILSVFVSLGLGKDAYAQMKIASTPEGDKVRAAAYKEAAQRQFNEGNYIKALEYCTQIENFTNKVDPGVEALRVKCYYAENDYAKAKIALDLFLRLDSDKSLKEEMFTYIVMIDDKIQEEEQFFENAKNTKSVYEYNLYLQRYPNGRYTHEVNNLLKAQLETDEWAEAQRLATTASFKTYLKQYPNGRYSTQAWENINNLDRTAFQQATSENTQESLNYYLDNFPEGKHRKEVNDKLLERIEYDLFMKAKNSKDIENFIEYTNVYPEGKYVNEANEEIENGFYTLGNTAYDSKNYHRAKNYFSKYVQRFPEGVYVVDVQKKLKKAEKKAK